jgi:hypothetical protein
MSSPKRSKRPVGRRVGRGGGCPAGVLARTEARLGGVSGRGRAPLVVSAFFSLQRPSLSSGGQAMGPWVAIHFEKTDATRRFVKSRH